MIPAIEQGLAKPTDRGERMARKLGGKNRQVESPVRLPGNKLRHAPAGLRRVHDAIAAIAECIEYIRVAVRTRDPRHHVVADIDPAPPGIVHRDAGKRREFARDALVQELRVARVCCVRPCDRCTAADLKAVIGQQALIKAQRARVGDDLVGAEVARGDLVGRKRARDHRI